MIYVTVLTCNRFEKLERLFGSRYFMPEIGTYSAAAYVLDQGSTDGTPEWLHALASRISPKYWGEFNICLAPDNAGIIGGHQRQIDWLKEMEPAPDDVIIFLDDDIYPLLEDWIVRLSEPFSDPKVGVVGCYGAHILDDWSMHQATEPGPVDVVNMSHTAVRAEIFLNGFEFPLQFGACWHEDAALCLWAKEHGYTVQYVGTPESIGLHHDPHHKETDDLYFKNWAILKEQYQGKGLVKGERNG